MDIIGLMGKKLKLGTYKIKCVSQLFCQDTKNDTGYTISYHRREKTKIRVFLERISFFFFVFTEANTDGAFTFFIYLIDSLVTNF